MKEVFHLRPCAKGLTSFLLAVFLFFYIFISPLGAALAVVKFHEELDGLPFAVRIAGAMLILAFALATWQVGGGYLSQWDCLW